MRVRRAVGIVGLSLLAATGLCAVPSAASAIAAHALVESRAGAHSASGMVCGLAVTRNGAVLMCVRRAEYATAVCSVPPPSSPGTGTDH